MEGNNVSLVHIMEKRAKEKVVIFFTFFFCFSFFSWPFKGLNPWDLVQDSHLPPRVVNTVLIPDRLQSFDRPKAAVGWCHQRGNVARVCQPVATRSLESGKKASQEKSLIWTINIQLQSEVRSQAGANGLGASSTELSRCTMLSSGSQKK